MVYVTVTYGFMEDPDVPAVLRRIAAQGVPIDEADVTYFLGRETLIATARAGMARWRKPR